MDELQKYFISIQIQGELDIINNLIEQTKQDNNLILYSTFIQDILNLERINLNTIKKEEAFYIEDENQYYASFEITTEIKTKDINKLKLLLNQDQKKLNKYFNVFYNKSIDILVAAKPLKFNEDSYIFVD